MTVFVDHVAAPWVLLQTYQPLQFAPLSCLIATWLRIAIFETIGLGEMVKSRDAPRRLWFAIDELDAPSEGGGTSEFASNLIGQREIVRETVSSSESSGAAEQNFAQTAISSRSIITFIRALGSDW